MDMLETGPFIGSTSYNHQFSEVSPQKIEYYKAPTYPVYSLPFKAKENEYNKFDTKYLVEAQQSNVKGKGGKSSLTPLWDNPPDVMKSSK